MFLGVRLGIGGRAASAPGTLVLSDAELATSGATPTYIGTIFPIPSGSIVTVDAQISCVNDGSTGAQIFNVRREFMNTAGTITAPAQTNTWGPDAIGAVIGASVAITYTGTTGRVDVTGVAATGIRWRMDRQVTTLPA